MLSVTRDVPNKHNPNFTSPSTERKIIQNDHLRDEWQGCGKNIDKHCFKYICQIVMGMSLMIFSMIQISREVKNQEIYFSILSGTLGVFLPQPVIKNDD